MSFSDSRLKLKKHSIQNSHRIGKYNVLTVILDGVGFTDVNSDINKYLDERKSLIPSEAFLFGNAVNSAYTPNFYALCKGPLFRTLKAHGKAVGLPNDSDMGNSEVGHNIMGAGRVFPQGASLVNEAIETGSIFQSQSWKIVTLRKELLSGESTLHFCGLLSDGNVHSHLNHLIALLRKSKSQGVKKVRLHLLLDGRDVPPRSALKYVRTLEAVMNELNDNSFHCAVASGGGRSFVTMDRYENDWSIVERGYNAHVCGQGPYFSSIEEAINHYREENPSLSDQDLPAFVITQDGKPIGKVLDNDGFIFFNFRGDRAIEFTRALTEVNFKKFKRPYVPKIFFAGMMQYDGDLQIPKNFLIEPKRVEHTLSEFLCANNIKQFACSETQKFGHVTYFWNGNRSGYLDKELENFVEVKSYLGPFEDRPWMKCAEITDITIQEMKKKSFQFGRINFANGDMVGHTSDFQATLLAMSALDICLGRLMKAAKDSQTILIITSDHGNAEQMLEIDRTSGDLLRDSKGDIKKKTSHTLSQVPFTIYNSEVLENSVTLNKDIKNPGLSSIASTILELLGFEAPSFFDKSLLLWPPKVKTNKEFFNFEDIKRFPRRVALRKEFSLAESCIAFQDVIMRLRDPKEGCPWNLSQSINSLRKYLIEESYEAASASNRLNGKESWTEYCIELGDLLLQIFLNSHIANDEGHFSIDDVFRLASDKIMRRHPHVFDKRSLHNNQNRLSLEDISKLWEKVKSHERKLKGQKTDDTILSRIESKKDLPTLDFAVFLFRELKKLKVSHEKSIDVLFFDISKDTQALKDILSQKKHDKKVILSSLSHLLFSLTSILLYFSSKYSTEDESLDVLYRERIEECLIKNKNMFKDKA